MIIQNFDSIFLNFSVTERECFFPKERFSNSRVIDYFFINPDFNKIGTWDNYGGIPMARATDGTPLIALPADGYYEFQRNYDGFLDIFDADQNHIIDKCSVFEFVSRQNNTIFKLNSTIDPSLSKVRWTPTTPIPFDYNHMSETKGALNIGICYCKKEENPESIITQKRSFELVTDGSKQRIYFKSFTRLGVQDKPIKKIIVMGDYLSKIPTDKYITIKTFNGREINALPSGFLCEFPLQDYDWRQTLSKRNENDIFFDDLLIDEDNSYIEDPCGSGFSGTITFYF